MSRAPAAARPPVSTRAAAVDGAPVTARLPATTPAAGGARRDRIPAGWGKFCADELAVAMAISRPAAERMLALAYDLAARLPRTAQALHEGVIDAYKAQIIAEATRVLDDAAAAAAEAAILGAGVAGKTPGQIRAAAGRAVLQADPAAARKRREEAQKDARVELWREDAGTAALCGFGLPPDAALAADARIRDRTVELKAAGVPGTMDQLRVRAYLDALLGQDTAAATASQHGTASPASPDGTARGGPRRGLPQRARTRRHRNRGRDEQARGTGRPARRPVRPEPGPANPRPGRAGPRRDRRLARASDPVSPGAGAGGDGGADQPDHPAGDPAGAGGAARGSGRVRSHRRGPGPRHGRPRRRAPGHQLVPDPHRSAGAAHRARLRPPHPARQHTAAARPRPWARRAPAQVLAGRPGRPGPADPADPADPAPLAATRGANRMAAGWSRWRAGSGWSGCAARPPGPASPRS